MNVSQTVCRWIPVLMLVPLIAACETDPETAQDRPEALPAGESPVPAQDGEPAGGASAAASDQAAPATPEGPGFNMNTATREAFLTIPDVGDHMVEEFFEYRPYVSIRQFRREIGKYVDEAQVAAYERYVFVPVDPNASDAATLQQIPGVDAAVAAALIEGRPYASNQAFLDALAAHVTEMQVTSAEAYLSTS